MATLIQLKQIESSSFLIQAAAIAETFTESVTTVVDYIGVISASSQLTGAYDVRYALSGTIGTSDWSSITGIPQGIISSSTQLDGSTLKNITISTRDADSYSLIVSGAMGVVDANNLPEGPNADDTNVPAQIYLAGGTVLPADPSASGSADANIIDQGEW
jgi:hypothetical protein